MSWAPFFHPSGKYLIFTANKLGFSNFELFLVDAGGRHEPVRVTFTDGFDGLPTFSPDGGRLCWTSTRTSDGSSQLFLAKWDHAAALAAIDAAPERSNTGASVPPESLATDRVTSLKSLPALSPEISRGDLQAEVKYLAGDALEGRMTGSRGARLASEYIAANLQQAGLRSLERDGSFFQPFEFTSGVEVMTNDNRLVITHTNVPDRSVVVQPEKDFRPLALTANGEVEGAVVFAGYGLSIPGKPGEGYNSYAGLDVTNRIVLVLRYVPESVEPKRRQELNRYASLRYKAMIAREHGAKALLVVTGPSSPTAGQLAPLAFDTSLSGSGIVAASISSNAAAALFAGTGKELASLQSGLDSESPHAEGGFVIPGVRVKIATSVKQIRKSDRNVLACLPPPSNAHEYILVGAHYDHLGFGETGAMLRQGEERQIHPGADDNASGVAAVLELASSFGAEYRRDPGHWQRGIIFAFWSGEELGLVGSSHFVEHPPVALSNLVANLNFDMVGRLRDNKLVLQGMASSSAWRRLVEKRNVPAGFNLALQDDPYLPTDVTAFYPKGVPVLNFFTGSHEDYHRPTDQADKLNYDGLERITQFARGLIIDLLVPNFHLDYAKVAASSAGGSGQRETLRAYLGTIPDYTVEVEGVKLSGVRGGSPAEKAGVKGGDVIVEFGGQQIKNIYDYTYALDAVKIGQPVTIIVLRNGERTSLSATPEPRK
jgi:hypothetical protein